ncbi:MAG TPA: sigma-54 dependent transcriptional regulator [Planctomycetia bacterium]|nr:sigma-54 dependent transcriptional regulator [Planctomycetia bacterium]
MANPTPGKLRILFADDERPLRELMRLELPRLGHETTACEDGRKAISAIEAGSFDVALLDIRMPGFTGIDVLRRIKEVSPETEVVLLTGHATVETAVDALRHGAFDYLTKPCKMAELEAVLGRIAEKRALVHRAMALEARLRKLEGTPRLIGASAPMMRVQTVVAKVAPTDSTVLILGETGTGKEVTARGIHDQSPRAGGPFVPVNCGALPEHLVESELFGHRKGAFTGADQNRKGLFEVADGGTLFLDEVGELPKAMQAKLLRFLESREVRRVGENEPFTVDVRVVCATNRDLREMASKEEFREDLYFRINTFEISLPSLRSRRDDIPELAEHLLRRASKGRHAGLSISAAAIEVLVAYDWPGNVRELANVMEHALILSGGETIDVDHLPSQLPRPSGEGAPTMPVGPGGRAGLRVITPPGMPLQKLHEVEMQYITQVLEETNGSKPEAAKILGISLKTLYNKVNAMQEPPTALAG